MVCVVHRLQWGEEVFLSPICVVHECNVLNKRDALNLAGWPYLTSQTCIMQCSYLIPIVSLWLYEGLEVS